MEQKKKNNIYRTAGKVGKVFWKSGGYLIAIGGTLLFTKLDIVKKIKK